MSDVLLVMFKPSGYGRICTPDEAKAFAQAWNAVLDWLQGADPDELPYSELVGEVARECALRTPRFPAYDVGLWAEQARDLDRLALPSGDAHPLPDLFGSLLTDLGLARTAVSDRRLNRVAIELIYGTTRTFHRHREGLVRRLLDGPVRVETWAGSRKEFAQAAKVLIRRTLSASPMSNLTHIEISPPSTFDQLIKATEIPNVPEWAMLEREGRACRTSPVN